MMVIENTKAPRLTKTETLYEFFCDQCGDRVIGASGRPATVWAVLVYKNGAPTPGGSYSKRHRLTCSQECGDAMLVTLVLEGMHG